VGNFVGQKVGIVVGRSQIHPTSRRTLHMSPVTRLAEAVRAGMSKWVSKWGRWLRSETARSGIATTYGDDGIHDASVLPHELLTARLNAGLKTGPIESS